MSEDIDPLEVAQSLIDDLAPGEYELEQIYGEYWDAVKSPTSFGKRFARAVRDGTLRNIFRSGRTAENHQLYRVSQGDLT